MTSTIALVRHRLADFDVWKKVYDGYAPVQAEHGVHAQQRSRGVGTTNER